MLQGTTIEELMEAVARAEEQERQLRAGEGPQASGFPPPRVYQMPQSAVMVEVA